MLDYGRLQQATLSNSPFDHVVVPHFVPRDRLASVVDSLPRLRKGGSYPIEALQLGEASKRVVAELQGEMFRSIIGKLFDIDLAQAPVMVTVRGHSRQKDGRIHADSSAKRVTVLLYLNVRNPDQNGNEGALRLLRGPDSLAAFDVEVPAFDGTLLVFPNTPTSWHGHERFVGRRYVVQLNYMANDRAARSEMRRHRLSALVKRVLAA